MLKLLKVGVLLSLLTSLASAQELPVFRHHFMNPYLYNPAYAGSEGKGALFLTHRRQWVGINEAPVTSNLSYHTPLSKGLSFGLNISNDERGIFNSSTGLVTFGYMLPLGKTHFIRFALSGGIGINSTDLSFISSLPVPADPAATTLLDNNTYLDGNFGISYHVGNFNIGLALPRIFRTQIVDIESFDVGDVSPTDDMIFNVNYRQYLANDNFVFEPRLYYRYSQNEDENQFEAIGILHIKNAMWIGGSYRQDLGLAGLLGFKFANSMALGYSIGIGPSDFGGFDNASHEIQLGIAFGKAKKRKTEQYYSFIDLHREFPPTDIMLTSTEVDENVNPRTEVGTLSTTDEDGGNHTYKLVRTGDYRSFNIRRDRLRVTRSPNYEEKSSYSITVETKDEDDLTFQKEFTITVKNVIDDDEVVDEPATEEPEPTPVNDPVVNNPDTTQNVTEEPEIEPETEPVKEQEPEPEIEPEPEPEQEPVVVPNPTPIDNQLEDEPPVIVKRGDHRLELPLGHYVIVGAFSQLENAQNYSDRLFQMGFKGSFGYLTEKQLYYVHLLLTDTPEKARAERDRLRQNSLFREAWYLWVQ